MALTLEDVQALHLQYGQPIVSRKSPDTEKVEGATAADEALGEDTRPTQNPVYIYQYPNGMVLTLKASRVDENGQAIEFDEVAPRKMPTAAESRPPVVASAPSNRFNPDGSPNLNYTPPAQPAPPRPAVITGAGTSEKTIPIMQPDGTIRHEPNPNYVDPATVPLTAAQRAQQQTADRNASISSRNADIAAANTALRAREVELKKIVEEDASKLAWAQFEYKKLYDDLQFKVNERKQQSSEDQFAAQQAAEEGRSLRADETSRRGQDITSRGQDLGYQQTATQTAANLGIEASRAMGAALPFVAPKGTGEDLTAYRNAITSGNSAPMAALPARTMPFPYDPQVLARKVADEAIAAMSPAAAAALGRPIELPRFSAPAAGGR